MSSTNRGSERNQLDAYYTPQELANAIVDRLPIQEGHECLEPHVGSAAFYRALIPRAKFVDACDLNSEVTRPLKYNKYDGYTWTGDFLEFNNSGQQYDWIVGNPPYSDAQAHVEKALSLLKDNGNLVFLLRLNFLGSKKRHEWWKDHKNNPLYKVTIITPRPSFTGGGTDSCEYAVFWWVKSHYQIPITSIDFMRWK